MRKLTDIEQLALRAVSLTGFYCPGDHTGHEAEVLRKAMDSLVKKKRVRVEMTDDGPRYEPVLDA